MASVIEVFKERLMTSELVMDPVGTHHEFSSGNHGRKLDFDKIPDSSQLFHLWIASSVEKIRSLYPPAELDGAVILSVAGGTNRLVQPVADRIGHSTVALLTEKTSPKTVAINERAERHIKTYRPKLTIVLEDVGTSGGTTLTAVESAQVAGASRIEPLITWQRREELEHLAGRVVYNAIIKEPLPEFTPGDCRQFGYCSNPGELFIPR